MFTMTPFFFFRTFRLHVRAFFSRPTGLSLGDRTVLAWGKIRRLLLTAFAPDYVRRRKEPMKGKCAQCGACCKLLYVCPHLESPEEPGMAYKCAIYEERPRNCRAFPIDGRDIRDRDLVGRTDKCGYHC